MNPSQSLGLATRLLGIILIVAALYVVCSDTASLGTKSGVIPTPNIVTCLTASAGLAVICIFFWRAVATPFVAGIAGVFAIGQPIDGPVGGVIGLLVGLLVVLLFSFKAASNPNNA